MESTRMHSTDSLFNNKKPQSRCLVISLGIGCIAMFVIGILIGRFATCPDEKPAERPGLFLPGVSEALVSNGDPLIRDELMNSISSDRIRENLRMLTENPHLAGTDENHQLALKLKEHWEDVGLDHVTLTPYRVLLSYPNMNDLNYVELLDENNGTAYKSNLTEPILTQEENKTNVVPPFNAYSAPGDIYGDLVYVNYGRVEDYIYLEQNKSINVSGKIVFARYGKIFRGDKVHLAEKRGAIGVVLFSDPEDVTDGDINQVYPKDWWLPPSGAQRGTVYIGDGDPLTAGYPAIDTAYQKLSPDEYLPGIPCHPIGYGIAIHLMRNLGGGAVPQNWQGGMNVTYRFGDGFRTTGWRAHIKVSTSNKNVTVYNAVGIIRGSIEPDRYVLIGNHRDAWVLGALDPSSGTAIMMEISRVMGQLVKSGRWRPRRSVIFCSWGAEEYGLVGSTEWVEHYTKSLGARAIAYLNVDIAVQGNFTFRALGTPLIFKSLYEATKKVPNPNATEISEGRKTVYDTWMKATPWEEFQRPLITLPGSGSDYAPFRDRLGVPVVDLRYTWDNRLKLSAYPMYHSVYETFYLVDEIMDRGFHYHKAIGQIWTEMARDLADSLIIPFNVSDYSSVITDIGRTFMESFRQLMDTNGIDTALLDDAIANFTIAVEQFESQMQKANLKDPFVVRRINDQLMQLDRAFLDPAGLPDRKLKRHILFAESTVDNYAGSRFPGLSDALTKIKLGEDVENQWQTVRKHYSVILFTFQSASATLKDVSDFMFSY
ncbi:N-acetylated-alpha-linked acidic dipeptidase 2-like [Mercenaria mercenaria]|uniref:N-acetylated-alpha-linked acidic dipeptidase 2-like n=1 Tax=Mercenaria mercenaria TaxID=6596 RepID=UPI00234F2016|nr:N-acetylated-alpha-linked acidic dipeptidase 2-like [Mercenaria mercenaria]